MYGKIDLIIGKECFFDRKSGWKMKPISLKNVDITGGFWKQKQDLVRTVTADSVYKRFYDTGRVTALKCNWKEGMPNQPHVFWDSDVVKWIEGVAYILEKGPAPELEAKADAMIEDIAQNQWEDGYFNTYFITVEPERRFQVQDWHELYCAGHMIEAAIAYKHATGKDKLLKCAIKYADLIDRVFRVEQSAGFMTPGHEEIELALVKLYRETGEKRYLQLALFFIDMRGRNDKDDRCLYNKNFQAHLPVREQRTAEGHAVRCMYLFSGVADVALETGDKELLNVCHAIFDNAVNRRMYITGGLGADRSEEGFTIDYDLPNATAYAETCAAIGLAFFAHRMQRFENRSIYGDIIEKVIYNGILSGLSLDGKAFFYENPLEIIPKEAKPPEIHYAKPQRSEVFWCSCCPPNIVRFIPDLGEYIYGVEDNTIFVDQFMSSKASVELPSGYAEISQETNYPFEGTVKITYHGSPAQVAVRIPAWYDGNEYVTKDGYAYYPVEDGSVLEFNFPMNVKLMEANAKVWQDTGCCAVMCGPLVYCMESVDNGSYLRRIRILEDGKFERKMDEELGLPAIYADGLRREMEENAPLYAPKKNQDVPVKVKLIPYFAFANRDESEMLVWALVK